MPFRLRAVFMGASKNFHPEPAIVIAPSHLSMRLRSTNPCGFAFHSHRLFFSDALAVQFGRDGEVES
jgi:hypothetical protein